MLKFKKMLNIESSLFNINSGVLRRNEYYTG
jgi:hypothetical protein